jgi:hypothetical protein
LDVNNRLIHNVDIAISAQRYIALPTFGAHPKFMNDDISLHPG